MIPGTVPVTGTFAPTDPTDVFATHDAKYGKGGWRAAATNADRNAIPAERRTPLMIVAVEDDGRTYQLKPEPWAYDDTDWDELVFNVATDVFYTNANAVPETLGGIVVGTTFDHVNITGVLDTLLYPLLNPAFTSFLINGVSGMSFEVGDSLPSDDYAFTWANTHPSFIVPDTINIYDHTGSVTLASGLSNDGAETVNLPYPISKTVRAAHYFRIQGENTKHLQFARYIGFEWLWYRYAGDSSDPALDEAGIQALTVASNLSKLMTGAFSFATPGYKYFAFPIDSGWINPYNGYFYVKPVESIRDANTNLNIAMADASDGYTDSTNGINHKTMILDNSFGYTQSYRVYRTKNVINGDIIIVTT